MLDVVTTFYRQSDTEKNKPFSQSVNEQVITEIMSEIQEMRLDIVEPEQILWV